MGCGSHKGVRIIPRRNGNIKLDKFTIQIEDPKTKDFVHFSYHTETDELPVMQMMNAFVFDEDKGEQIDGNFISILNKDKN